jgi:integrase
VQGIGRPDSPRKICDQEVEMASSEFDKGYLVVRAYKGTPFYEAKWRNGRGRQRKRRLGRAWLEENGDGQWVKKRGRVPHGYLDEKRAYREMGRVISEVEAEREPEPGMPEPLFDDAIVLWIEYLENERRTKPSTLAGYRNLLAEPRSGDRSQRGARIMRAFGGRRLRGITTDDVREFLSKIDREGISARTVNIHRQVLHAIFQHAMRSDAFGLRDNPVSPTEKRPEEGTKPIETFEPRELHTIAAAARKGLHRRRSGYADARFSEETEREWKRMNEQDAALFIVAGCTGLRMGELLALRWSDVDIEAGNMMVSRAMSAGHESSTKSRRPRSVPLADQANAELKAIRNRERFVSREDLVFCRPDGGPLDRSAVRARFVRAQRKAGVRMRRFHDLRHTFGSLAILQFDVVAVKDMMGHSRLTTTERYLHSKPRPGDAAKLTAVFEGQS